MPPGPFATERTNMLNIDQEKIEAEELTWFEAQYLKDRGRLPKGYPMPEAPEEEPPEVPKSRVTPLEEQTVPTIEVLDEDPEPAPSKARVTPLEDQALPTISEPGGIVEEDEEEDYLVGWNNDQRRAALSSRGLSVAGGKDELIARLRRSDVDELIDGDEALNEA